MRKDPKDTEESFLSRWSRRKTAVTEEAVPGTTEEIMETPSAGELESVQQGDTEEKQAPENILTDKDMPDIDALDEKSDFSMFMSEGVSEELRNLALRKLFKGATFNIRDGLDDYDDDFTTFANLGDLVTADMRHREEMKEKIRLREEEEAQQLAEEASEEELVEEEVKDEEETNESEEPTETELAEESDRNPDETRS